jgi:hypothetical protein
VGRQDPRPCLSAAPAAADAVFHILWQFETSDDQAAAYAALDAACEAVTSREVFLAAWED